MTPHTRRLVVIGNGMAGQRLVELLADGDTEQHWQVTVIAEEGRPAYDRVNLTSCLTGGGAAGLALAPDGFYDGARRVLLLGDPAVRLDRAARLVRTRSGRVIGYDAAVLATGSRPFVPPTPGSDLPGCFTYRTLDDLDGIRARAATAGVGAVVGGGLLGLEAADALRRLGLDVHVIEAAQWLMPAQVDQGGGQALSRHIRSLGLHVHLGVVAERVQAGRDGSAARLTLANGSVIEAGLVVFAAGIRPRDELARAAGLPAGERGGVRVDAACRTPDPRVWAIGECAEAGGRVHGLVAPGYAMAEVVAGRLLGRADVLGEVDTSAKLKLLDLDVASFGEAQARTPGALELVWADQVAGVYKKLVVTDDAATLLGGVLVGDASAFPVARALVGRPIGGPPESLILPAAAPSFALPADAAVCSCHAVARDAVLTAITRDGCADVAAIKSATRAGTGCGSCVPLLKRLLDEAGVEQPRGLCEHFAHTRAELLDIVVVRQIRTFSQLIAEHGHGRGCDICKPAVASILASLHGGHVLDPDQAALQDTNDHFLANMQKDGSYSVVPRVPGGEISPGKLIAIGEVARDFGLYTKITGAQRIDMFGARVDQLPQIWRRLVDAGFESGHAYGKAVRTVKSCVGDTWCRYGVQDSAGLAIELELRYRGLRAPHKVKAGVSGCARECAEARGKDFGVIATESGWNLYVGGNGGFRPRHAELLAGDLDRQTLIRVVDRFLVYYIRTADRLQRTAAWIEGMDGGLDHLRAVILDDALGICADLDAAMERHVAAYTDEWRGVLDDPGKLRRFSSFVNAPGETDTSIVFVAERGQPRPARPGEKPDPGPLIAGGTVEVIRA